MTAFSYRRGNTAVHRMGAGVKLALLFGLSAASVGFGLPALAAAAVLVLLGARLAALGPRDLFTGARKLGITLAAVTMLRALRFAPLGIDLPGLAVAGLFSAGVLVSFAAGSVVFATTKISAMREALGAAERGIRRIIVPSRPVAGGGRISLGIALVLAFLPRVFAVWEEAETAYRGRFGPIGLRSVVILVPLTAERLMEAAAETAQALALRGSE